MKAKENRLVVGDLNWADTIPDWLLEAVKHERLTLGLVELIPGDVESTPGEENAEVPNVGDAEVCAYLYTASLHAPMSAEHSQIYFYLGAKVIQQYQPDTVLPPMMTEAIDRGLTNWEARVLIDLRHMIYRKRGGEITHPILDAMRVLKKEVEKAERDPQLSFL